MKQPKFKFGDVVIIQDSFDDRSIPWKIDTISYVEGVFLYRGKGSSSDHGLCVFSDINEIYLSLYQKPFKKKLYAYEDSDGWVGFRKEPFDPIKKPSDVFFLGEYDIEYPDLKLRHEGKVNL